MSEEEKRYFLIDSILRGCRKYARRELEEMTDRELEDVYWQIDSCVYD